MKLLLSGLTAVALLAAASPALAFDWNGFYAGVGAGYTWAEADSGSITMEPNGWSVGGVAGYNAVLGGGFVLGVEGSVDWTDIVDDYTEATLTVTSTTDWAAALRARVGFDAGEFLPYVTAGVVWAHGTVTLDNTVPALSFEDDAVMTGGIIGAGVEFAASDSMTIKAEYLYTKFAENTWFEGSAGPLPFEISDNTTSSTVRVGINFHF